MKSLFSMVFGLKTIDTNGFWSGKLLVPMIFRWFLMQWQWLFNGFVVGQLLETMVFQWFPMVGNHWSNDGMVTIHRRGLVPMQAGSLPMPKQEHHLQEDPWLRRHLLLKCKRYPNPRFASPSQFHCTSATLVRKGNAWLIYRCRQSRYEGGGT